MTKSISNEMRTDKVHWSKLVTVRPVRLFGVSAGHGAPGAATAFPRREWRPGRLPQKIGTPAPPVSKTQALELGEFRDPQAK